MAFASSPVGDVGTHRGHLRVRLTEQLTITHTTHGITIASLNHRPEVLGEVIIIRIVVSTIGAQGTSHHGDMLVGMTRADGVDILSQGVKEGWTIEIVGSLQKMGLLFSIASHLGETRQRLCHTSHLASDVHVPHLIAIARTSTTLCLRSFAFDVSTIVQTVPHPQSHILGNEQGLGGSGFVIDIGGNVDESCQLLMHRIIWCPHPTVVIIGTIHLNQDAMLGRDGIQITVAILLVSLFIAVKVGPRALHLLQLFLRGEVACLPVATQLFIPYKGPLLTLAQSVDHLDDMLFEDGFLVWVLTTGKSKGQCRHIVT